MGIKKLSVFIHSKLIFTSKDHKMLLAVQKRWGTACRIENISTLVQGDRSFLSSYKCSFSKLKKQLVK